jgi:hypothetical protein
MSAAMTSHASFGAFLERNVKDYTGRWKLKEIEISASTRRFWWGT